MKFFPLKPSHLLSIASVSLFLAAGAKGQNLFRNESFENWGPNCPANTAPVQWTNSSTSGGPDQAGLCIGGVYANSGDSFMNLEWVGTNRKEGAQQTINNMTVGAQYLITYYVTFSGLYAGTGDCKVELSVNGNLLSTTPNIPVSTAGWTGMNIYFTPTQATNTIKFQVIPGDDASVGGGSVGIDDVSIMAPVGIDDIVSEEVQLFPNPSEGILNLSSTTFSGQNTAFVISNVLGQQVWAAPVSFHSSQAQIDLSQLKPGLYNITVMANGLRADKLLQIK